jgi:Fe-S-cluster-containing hydrogenase component 2
VFQFENFKVKVSNTRVITNIETIQFNNDYYGFQFISLAKHMHLGRHVCMPTPLGAHNMQKILHINPDKCTGCMQCEMACSFENYGTFATAKSRIKVFDFHHTGKKVPYTCTQCDEAWCLHACPVEAITVDRATGAKVVNESTCVGCKVCTIACPFGTINYVEETGKVQKCDLCGGDPACATACPTGAITFIDANWTGLGKMAQWADKLGNQPSAS